MTKPDWILVETTDPAAIQERVLLYAELCEPASSRPRTATVRRAGPDTYAVTFEPAAPRCDLLNLVGYLADDPRVARSAGWITDRGTRYGLAPDPSRTSSSAETEYLIGRSAAGAPVEACLSDGVAAVRPARHAGEPLDEPGVEPGSVEPTLRFVVELGA